MLLAARPCASGGVSTELKFHSIQLEGRNQILVRHYVHSHILDLGPRCGRVEGHVIQEWRQDIVMFTMYRIEDTCDVTAPPMTSCPRQSRDPGLREEIIHVFLPCKHVLMRRCGSWLWLAGADMLPSGVLPEASIPVWPLFVPLPGAPDNLFSIGTTHVDYGLGLAYPLSSTNCVPWYDASFESLFDIL